MGRMGVLWEGVVAVNGGWWFLGGPRPMAARLPSPWDPLLISPWEGEGNGSRERGHVVVGGGTAVDWGEGV